MSKENTELLQGELKTTNDDNGVISSIVKQSKTDLISYLKEYPLLSNCHSQNILNQQNKIIELVNEYDIILIGKEGCGFCARAKEMLIIQQQSNDFTLKFVIGTSADVKGATALLLNLSDITFPQIIIHGVYIGGSDELRDLIESTQFNDILASKKVIYNESSKPKPVVWLQTLEQTARTPNLFLSPRFGSNKEESSWYCYQFYMYGNLVRYISIFQIILMAICTYLFSIKDHNSTATTMAYTLSFIFVYDLAA
jgi:glutaredoxin-related protein